MDHADAVISKLDRKVKNEDRLNEFRDVLELWEVKAGKKALILNTAEL